MNCAACEERILDAPGSGEAEVERHLAGCASCRAFRESQLAVHAVLVRGLGSVQLSGGFEARVRARVKAERSLKRLRRAIASLEAALGLGAVAAAAFAAPLAWPNLMPYLPAAAAAVLGLTVVWEFISGESS